MDKIDISIIERNRIYRLLALAKTPGKDEKKRYENYIEALSLSYGKRGYDVLMKRDTDETYINNYNIEYLLAWDCNMDIQVCLDYFAIITYILDYKMKDESGTLEEITKALKQDNSEGLRKKLSLVAHTFLTHRRAGECEIMYKLFPSLHLTYSNIGVTFIPTGFPENMSRMLKEVNENSSEAIDHEGKKYVAKENLYDKYLNRDDKMLCITYTQFVQRYVLCSDPKIKEYDLEKEFYSYLGNQEIKKILSQKTEVLEDDFIFERLSDNENRKQLPTYIPLKTGRWMKLRSKKVLRFFKIKQTPNPHEYYFTQLQMYTPFMNEEELFPNDPNKCIDLYNTKVDVIKEIKGKILPHLDPVTEGRERAEIFHSDVGTDLDPMNEQGEEIAREEGDMVDDEMAIINPENSEIIPDSRETGGSRTYRKIEVEKEEDLLAKVHGLDKEQRSVIDLLVGYGRQLKMYDERKTENHKPAPPLILVHGNAGTGKSHVISILSQLLEKTFRKSGDNPDHPYLLRLAYTGSAADIISGQTINKTFGLPPSNKIKPMNDKIRDARRTELQNLKLIIIDEISLVSADQLYQIHFRLSKDIKQNDLPFGNIAIVLFGDLLQIKPVSGPFVFEEPANRSFLLSDSWCQLWKKIKSIELKTNHRSGEFGIYADLLNRVRIGEPSKDDIEKLNSRVFPRNSTELPKDAVFCSGENKVVDGYNLKKLNELGGELYTRKADIFSSTKKEIKSPKLDSSGNIHNTQIPYEVKLKIGARVMLTYNIDVVDSLVNGSMGELVGFKRAGNNTVKFIMAKFDNDRAGKNRRQEINITNFPGATAISLLEQEFDQGKDHSTPATAINWPIKLSWGITMHTIQGMTITNPKCLILDLDCWLRAAMIYVAFSRIQTISQLFILERSSATKYKSYYNDKDKIPINMIKPWPQAMKELSRLQSDDIGPFLTEITEGTFKVVSLNVISLAKHFRDIKADPDMNSANVIMLQETSLTNEMLPDENYDMGPQYRKKFINLGQGKGVAAYFPNTFEVSREYSDSTYQMITIESDILAITNIYRSSYARVDFSGKLINWLAAVKHKNHLIVGDFNYCIRKDINHNVINVLETHEYKTVNNALHKPPEPTHLKGRCIDHAWIKTTESMEISLIDHSIKTCVYSDHEKVMVELSIKETDI